MTAAAKAIIELFSEGETIADIAEAMSLEPESVEAIITSHKGSDALTRRATSAQELTQEKIKKYVDNIEHLADYAESESVRFAANQYLLEEATGRNAAKAKIPVVTNTNILVINEAMKKAKEAVQRSLKEINVEMVS